MEDYQKTMPKPGPSEEAATEGGPSKRLRYTDPDLKVVVKCTTGSEKIYHMYAQNLARLSTFVDTSLSVDMKEKRTMEIAFHHISPAQFEKALSFLEHPLEARSMTPTDALELIPFYDQYQFSGGLILCDEVLSLHIAADQTAMSTLQPPDDLDLLIQAVGLAHRHDLPKTKQESISYLNARFHADPSSPFGPTMFSEEHMRVLQPIFQEYLLTLPAGFSRDDLDSAMFPKYFVKFMACEYATKMTQFLTLHGTEAHDGIYRKEGDRFIAPTLLDRIQVSNKEGVVVHVGFAFLVIDRSEHSNNEWAILCKPLGQHVQHVLWRCPYSQNLTFPPLEPWLPVNATPSNREVKIKNCTID